MKKNVNELIKKLIGTTDEFLFEEMLYHGICLFGLIGVLVISSINIVYKLHLDLVMNSIMVFYIGSMFYLGRFKRRYFFSSFYLFMIGLILISYLRGYGTSLTFPIYLLLIFILALAYYPLKWHKTLFTFHIILLCLIFFIEYQFPNLITNLYKSQEGIQIALVACIYFSSILCFIGIHFLKRSYDNERKKNLNQKTQLEKSAHEKSLFFINLSHEIKTPLTLVENYLDKYIQRKGEDRELLVMRQNIRKMRQDIIEYLDIENLERGSISYEKKDVICLSRLLSERIELFISYANNKKLDFEFNIQEDVHILANLKGIDQIVNNLIENAIKYTPEKERIKISLTTENNNVRFSIKNSGIFISEDHISHLFEPFYQLSNEKQNIQGIGMGLYIVKKIVDNTQGQIFVESNKDIGVEFTVLLSLVIEKELKETLSSELSKNSDAFLSTAAIRDSQFNINRLSLLIVEDNADLLQYLTDELSEQYNIFVADNGLTAIDKLKTIPVPEVIISDIMMDKMDGYALLKKTLNDDCFSHIPFILLTAKDTKQEKIIGLQSGAIDFITKPFSIDELKTKIQTIINHKNRIAIASVKELKDKFSNLINATKVRKDEIFNENLKKYNLTAREKEIMENIRQGLKYEKIGDILHISEHTVIRHVQNIYKKTGSSTKIALIDKMYST